MLFSFSNRLLVLSVLAGALYYLMKYPMVFEKMRKYLPFKFNNTKIMLIFNSVVFSLVMYFVGFILLKSLHLEGLISKQTPTPTPSYPRITGLWTGKGDNGPVYIYIYKSGLDYSGKIVEGSANWTTVEISCGEDREEGNYDPHCANKMSFRINAHYNSRYNSKGTVNNNIIRWDDSTIWTKTKKYIEEPWVDPPPITWGFIKADGRVSCSQNASSKYYRTEADCIANLRNV